jgi:hypothetical protein
MQDERPMWELKAVATLLLAVALLSTLFGIITQELFNSILLAVINLFLLNTSSKLITLYKLKFKVLSFFMAVDWKIKVVSVIASVVVLIGYWTGIIAYDLMLKFMGIVATILAGNITFLEFKLLR